MRKMMAEKYLGWVTDGPWGFRGEVFRQTLGLWPVLVTTPGKDPGRGSRLGGVAFACGPVFGPSQQQGPAGSWIQGRGLG